MSESTLSLQYNDLLDAVCDYLGLGSDYDNCSTEEKAKIERIVKRGLRQFYYPPPLAGQRPHKWNFLTPAATLTTVASYSTGTVTVSSGTCTISGGSWPTWAATNGTLVIGTAEYPILARVSNSDLTVTGDDVSAATAFVLSHNGNYDLPDDFGGIEGDISYVGRYQSHIIITSEADVRRRRTATSSQGYPAVAAVRPKTTDGSDGQRFEIMFAPIPNDAYTLSYRKQILPDALTGTVTYPYGGSIHAETIEASCLAIAELQEDETKGPQWDYFLSRLAVSIQSDKSAYSAEFLGYNGDESDTLYAGGYKGSMRSASAVSYVGVSSSLPSSSSSSSSGSTGYTVTDFVQTLFAAANAEEVLSMLGFSAYTITLRDEASKKAFKTALDLTVSVKDWGAVGNGTADDTTAIQNAIDSLTSGGTVFFPEGTYKITSQLTISNWFTRLAGCGPHATIVKLAPSAAQTAILFNGTAYCGIEQFSIHSDDTTYVKVGLACSNVEEFDVRCVDIGFGGTQFKDSSNASIGLKIMGRQAITVHKCNILADKPIVIAQNPDRASAGFIDIDHAHFSDLYLLCIDTTTNPCVTIETGVNLTNVTFDGYQAWVWGGYGLKWVDTTTTGASQNLVIKNVRWEGSTNANGYIVDIEHNYVLYDVVLENLRSGSGNDNKGYKFRKIVFLTGRNLLYGGTSTALDMNDSLQGVLFENCFFASGSTVTATSLYKQVLTPQIAGNGTLSGIVFYDKTSPIKTLANDGTPSVAGYSLVATGGTAAITNFTGGHIGQQITVLADHAVTITDGTNIFLNGSADFEMQATDTLTLVQKADGKWYEVSRSDNT